MKYLFEGQMIKLSLIELVWAITLHLLVFMDEKKKEENVD